MKKAFLLSMLLISVSMFSKLIVIPDSTIVYVGETVEIQILTDEKVIIDFNLGGFENPEIIFNGVSKDSWIKYIAPLIEASDTLVFKTSKESTSITFCFVRREEKELKKSFAKVRSFSGNVAIRKGEVWNSVSNKTTIEEGNEILTLENSYVEIEFEDGSISKILENSQVLFEKIRYENQNINVEMYLKKGKNYNIVKKFLSSGSKFRVKTQSVTAGVKGTRFAVVNLNSETKILTYEGTVFAYFDNGKILSVVEGHAVKSFEPPKKIDIPEDNFLKLETKINSEEIKRENIPETKDKEEPPTVPKNYIPPVSIGPTTKNGKDYMIYSISPEFDLGFILLGIGFTAYSTSVSGDLYYGLPSDKPSTNIINAFTLNSISFKIGGLSFKYGNMKPISIGMGFSIRNYYNPYAKTFDIGIETEKFSIFINIPYELSKIYPPEFEKSDSVFLGKFGVKTDLPLIGKTVLGLGTALDNNASKVYLANSESTPISNIYTIFVKKTLMNNMDVGIELSIEKGLETYSYGIFGGLYSNLGFLNIIGGTFYHGDNFVPYYFNKNYANLKSKQLLPGMENESSSGYLVGIDIAFQYLQGSIYLNGTFRDISKPTLEGKGTISIPEMSEFSGLYIIAYYFDATPFNNGRLLSDDTISYVKINYPLIGKDFTAGIILEWNENQWNKNMVIGIDTWR